MIVREKMTKKKLRIKRTFTLTSLPGTNSEVYERQGNFLGR